MISSAVNHLPLVRAMANTLNDHGIDRNNPAAMITCLINAGFASWDITQYWSEVSHMKTTDETIRDMANALHDHDVDLLDSVAISTVLINSRFPVKLIEKHITEVITMAMIRKTNERRIKR